MTDQRMTLIERLRFPAWVTGVDIPALDVERTRDDMEEAARVIEMVMMSSGAKTEDRTKVAYEAYRAGFGDKHCPAPPWEEAAPWIRDLVTVAYLQGTLDGRR